MKLITEEIQKVEFITEGKGAEKQCYIKGIFLQRYSYVCSYVDSVAPKYYPSGIIFGGTHKIRIIICIV